MCPSMIRKLKVIVYFRKVFLLSKFKYFCFVTILDMSLISRQGLINPLARRPGLVISTFGLAEIISCMPDGLVKIYIGY